MDLDNCLILNLKHQKSCQQNLHLQNFQKHLVKAISCCLENPKIRCQTAQLQMRQLIMSCLFWICAVCKLNYFWFGTLRFKSYYWVKTILHVIVSRPSLFWGRRCNSYRMSARGAWIGTTSARGNVNSKGRQPRRVYIPRAEVIPIHAPRARIW